MWSPSAPNWRVGLSARQLTLSVGGGFGRASVVHREPITHADGAGPEPWRATVAALARMLRERQGRAPALRVVLSGRFVRWQLLPWRAELGNAREMAAYATLRFRETYGHGVTDWQVLHVPQPPGWPVPACAVDLALLEALRGACAGSGARLHAVAPYFASAFDHWRRALGRHSAWFGLIEPDGVSLALLQERRWIGLHTQRVDGGWRSALPAMLAQLGIGAEASATPVPLYLAGCEPAPARVDGLPFTWLQDRTRGVTADADCRMALGV